MTSLVEFLDAALVGEAFVRLILSQPIESKQTSGAIKIAVRPVILRDSIRYQWTSRIGSQEHHENLTAEELKQRVTATFGAKFADAHLFTTSENLSFKRHPSGQIRMKKSKATLQLPADLNHNREKQHLIPVGIPCPFLIEIGVMLANGQVRSAMYHKFRQINRYLELVNDVLPNLPSEGMLNVVDFGCGKSYLTFALYHLLTRIHQRDVIITGLDLKDDVIADCNRIARILGCSGLQFEVGRIDSFQPRSHVHLAVSLHACDTATDDALASAIRWKCDAILAVPCCQHELNSLLDSSVLPGLTEYGILRERFASMATDALRSRFLDLHGYRTQILEFIDLEHTPKNLLVRAERRQDFTAAERQVHQSEYEHLKADLKINSWHLEKAMQ